MPEDLKNFVAVFAEWTGPECGIVGIKFSIEDEKDALEIAEAVALLEGSKLILFGQMLKQ